MIEIIPRLPNISWNEGFDRHWYNGIPAITHIFNALSFLFPQAERFFIEVSREVINSTDKNIDITLRQQVDKFITQEATHTGQHNKYNSILEEQGFKNTVYDTIEWLQKISKKHFSPLTRLAVVCGYEHYTAILGNFILSNSDILKSAHPKMALIWGWHSAEETEHKAVCFDLYKAAGGGWLRRILVFLLVSLDFIILFLRTYIHLLHRDGCLTIKQLPKTIFHFSKFFFGRRGVAWHLIRHGVSYFSPRFHPWNQRNQDKLESWLINNQSRLRRIGEKC